MNKTRIKIYQSVTILIFLSTTALIGNQPAQLSYEVTPSISNIDNTAVNQLQDYLIANYHQFGGDMKKAYERYKNLIQNQAPSFSYKGYIHLLYETGNLAHVLQLMPKVDLLFKDNQDIQMIFAKTLEQAGKNTEADVRFITLNQKFKTNQEIAFQAAHSYLRRQEPENAISVIDTLLNSSQRRPNNYIFYFMKAQILLQLNKKNDALTNVQKSLELHPHFDKGWLLYALLNEQEGQLTDAIKGYSTFIELTGSNKEIEEHLLQLLFKQKIEQQSSNKLNMNNKKCFEKALLSFDEKKYEEALSHINVCLKETPHADESKVLKVQILSAMNKIDALSKILKEWMIQEPLKQVWYQTLHLLTHTNLTIAKAIEILHAVEKATSNKSHLPILYLADLYMRNQDKKKSLLYLEKAASITKDAPIKCKVLFQLGLRHYDDKNFDEMKNALIESRKLDPAYAPTANLLAYYYATDGNNLKEAQALITPVVKKYKNNPHYLDTQALIYLKKQQYVPALQLLQKLAKRAPSDYTILIHLSEAQHGAGLAPQALHTVEEAKKYAKTTQEKQECIHLTNQWKTKKA